MTSPAHNKPSQRGEQAFAQNVKGGYPTTRMRRLRSSGWMREMIAAPIETAETVVRAINIRLYHSVHSDSRALVTLTLPLTTMSG